MTDAATVGELDGETEVLVFKTSGTKAHLPAADNCPVQERADHDGRRKAAAVLWDDTEICPDCRGVVERYTGESTLPTQTEVPSDD